jgi:hypothetical protein
MSQLQLFNSGWGFPTEEEERKYEQERREAQAREAEEKILNTHPEWIEHIKYLSVAEEKLRVEGEKLRKRILTEAKEAQEAQRIERESSPEYIKQKEVEKAQKKAANLKKEAERAAEKAAAIAAANA